VHVPAGITIVSPSLAELIGNGARCRSRCALGVLSPVSMPLEFAAWQRCPQTPFGDFLAQPPMPTSSLPPLRVLTAQDGEELVRLLNAVAEIARTAMVGDLHLHYRDGKGWRARFGGSSAAKWVDDTTGPWSESPAQALAPVLQLHQKALAEAQKRKPFRKIKAAGKRKATKRT
jgi:hypothetical protein